MTSRTIYHRMKVLNARMMTNYRRGFGPARRDVVDDHRARVRLRVTPLQYESGWRLLHHIGAWTGGGLVQEYPCQPEGPRSDPGP
ncbi:MAG: hypothetical protein MZU84_06900 [Sphingobacterium sp.]|nr:hypothetical protein [Sphingobacterium sp.]